jgi:hypothetical protein
VDNNNSQSLDFDNWLKNYTSIEVKYFAIYDPENFKVVGIYPKGPAEDKQHKIPIETVIAEEIINGKVALSLLSVDVESEELIISEKEFYITTDTNFYKITSESRDLVSVSLTLKHVIKDKKLYFTASDNLIKQKDKFKNYKSACLFYITNYYDPNVLYDTIVIDIEELFSKKQLEFILDTEKIKFSVFTRKIFNSYYFVEQ